MDWKRQGSGCSINARLHPDDLGRITRIEWYEVPEDRKIMPYATPFRSHDWESPNNPPLLGEIVGPGADRRYFAGDHDDLVSGETFCGSRQQWENGPSTLDLAGKKDPVTGVPCCCGRGVAQTKPGFVISAEAEKKEFVGTSGCSHFASSPYSKFWTWTITGVTESGVCFPGAADPNGKHIVEERSPGECYFLDSFTLPRWSLQWSDSQNRWLVVFEQGGYINVIYRCQVTGPALPPFGGRLFILVPSSAICYTGFAPSILVSASLPP